MTKQCRKALRGEGKEGEGNKRGKIGDIMIFKSDHSFKFFLNYIIRERTFLHGIYLFHTTVLYHTLLFHIQIQIPIKHFYFCVEQLLLRL